MTAAPITAGPVSPPAADPATTPTEAHLRRLRWAVRATLTLGVAASVAANILHARPNPISQIIAAWPPLALLLTVELISRVPNHRRSLGAVRLVATAAIAGIAGWVSYWHMVGVAARYGETGAAASYLLPISVDGLVVVASISLVEIAGQIRIPSTSPVNDRQPVTAPAETPSPTDEPPRPETPASASGPVGAAQLTQSADVLPTVQPQAANRRDESEYPAPEVATHAPTGASGIEEVSLEPPLVEARDPKDASPVRTGGGSAAPADTTPSQVEGQPHLDADRPGTNVSNTTGYPPTPIENSDERDRANPPADAEDGGRGTSEDHGRDTNPDDGGNKGQVPSDTAGAVAYWYRHDPSLHPADIATRIGRSERTVRRYWRPVPRTANGHGTSRLPERLGAS